MYFDSLGIHVVIFMESNTAYCCSINWGSIIAEFMVSVLGNGIIYTVVYHNLIFLVIASYVLVVVSFSCK